MGWASQNTNVGKPELSHVELLFLGQRFVTFSIKYLPENMFCIFYILVAQEVRKIFYQVKGVQYFTAINQQILNWLVIFQESLFDSSC